MRERVFGNAISELNPPAENLYIFKTIIPNLLIIKRPLLGDERGFFQEFFKIPDIEQAIGRPVVLKQQSITGSKAGVIKGIHAENQDKVVTPYTGRIIQVVVDLNPNSPTFKKWLMFDFDYSKPGVNRKASLFLGDGLGNAYCVVKAGSNGLAEYLYSVSKTYDSSTKVMGVRYDDQEIGIPWPIKNPIVSERDKNMQGLGKFIDSYR